MKNTSIAVLAALICFGSVQSQTYSGINCATTKTDAFCNANSTLGPGGMCCATIVQTSKANATATTTTTATSYECLPAELVTKLTNPVIYSGLVNYTYTCANTTVVAPTACSAETCGDGMCCASRSAQQVSNTTQFVLPNYCTARNTSSLSWTISNISTSTQAWNYTRYCQAVMENSSYVLSSVAAIFLTFFLAALY